ncbi:MAG: nucleotidyltransferase domain-containing protein [Candidatus Eisenbacteria bacterium]|nr:nucleotidyltransferase domain-containing protein [Candidatus Eisenbacteria bacterium]
MPVRSLNSSVFRWPESDSVKRALLAWAAQEVPRHPGLLRLGYFGSYARGNAGVGSDLDLLAVVETADTPFMRRGMDWDLLPLPAPAEIVVYTREEWVRLQAEAAPFARRLARETVWIWPEENAASMP